MKFLVPAAFSLISLSSFAQPKQTFDLVSYSIPSGWKKTSETANVISYAITNNQKGTYCQLGIYKSTTSKGNSQADFLSEWQALIVSTYKPTTKPELQPATAEKGWDVQSGVAPFEFNGGQSAAMLITMSGNGRCVSIVVLTNTEDYQEEIQQFLNSINLTKTETPNQTDQNSNASPSGSGSKLFAFTTTNFDDGWTSTVKEDWVEVIKGVFKVRIHYPNKVTNEYNPNLMDGLSVAWYNLVAPSYDRVTGLELKPISGWQSIEYAEATASDKVTGKPVHVVLFKYNYSTGNGRFMEFISPDKASFEMEFGPYHPSTDGWDKMEKMLNYNKFAVGEMDLKGIWSNNFSGSQQYVNAATGANAGIDTHASNEKFEFGPGNSYQWSIGVASGFVGNIKFQSAKSNGKFSLISPWQVTFSDIEGKPRTYSVMFSCVKGTRILWIGDTGFGRSE